MSELQQDYIDKLEGQVRELRQRINELEPFKAAYLEQIDLHNNTLDDFAACENERINALETYARHESKRIALIDRLMNRISELECALMVIDDTGIRFNESPVEAVGRMRGIASKAISPLCVKENTK
jgi:uncharacterized coiled-coil DUF342 family protein